MEYVADVQEYADRMRPQLQQVEDSLMGSVRYALRHHGEKGWYNALVSRAVKAIATRYRTEAGRISGPGLRKEVAAFRVQVEKTLKKVEPSGDLEVQARAVAGSLAAAIVSTATLAAAHDSDDEITGKVWIDMDDNRVRPAHREANGQVVPLNEKFDVAGSKMDRPGDMSAPIELWINCRCILGIQSLNRADVASVVVDLVADASRYREGIEKAMTDLAEFADAEVVDLVGDDDDLTVPWYGVLAPEDVMSGDNRKFAPEALTWRDLPLPLAWQKVNNEGHDGSVVVGRIDEIWRDGGLLKARGVMLSTAEADEAVGLLSERGIRGVSVDVDSATMQMEDMEGNVLDADSYAENAVMNVTKGRICGATLCAIPAFMEAHILLGLEEEEPEALVASGADCLPCQYKAGIDEEPFEYTRADYTDDQWREACLLHEEATDSIPIYTPTGRLSRAAVLRAAEMPLVKESPYLRSLVSGALTVLGDNEMVGDDVDYAYRDDLMAFVKTEDGPGWLTHPVDTQRLRHYWTKGKGALKIRWGVPGDFNRCRLHLAKYIKPQYLNGYCANRHYDALGFWPGRPVAAETKDFSGPALHLVASGAWDVKPPRAWFEDPKLTGPSPIVITEEGRVFGHLAVWGQCHIGFGEDRCTLAPESASNYAYFRVGAVLTDEGDVPVGHITMDTGHAGEFLSAAAAAAHYDNTGTVVADVAAGRDSHGIWVAGVMRPDATEKQKYELRAATLSGDWRRMGTGYELVAALAVNVPGFPIPRLQIAASGGRQVSLVAAGIVPPTLKEVPDVFDIEAFAEAVAMHMDGLAARREKMASLKVATRRDAKSRMKALAGGKD